MCNIRHNVIIEYNNGTYYKGSILGNNTRHGKGYMSIKKTDFIYEDGFWYNDYKNGQFYEITQDLNISYDGMYMHNVKHGYGISVINDNKYQYTYFGEWKNDMKHGNGTLKIKENNTDNIITYNGLWSNNLKHGIMHISTAFIDDYQITEWCNDINISTITYQVHTTELNEDK